MFDGLLRRVWVPYLGSDPLDFVAKDIRETLEGDVAIELWSVNRITDGHAGSQGHVSSAFIPNVPFVGESASSLEASSAAERMIANTASKSMPNFDESLAMRTPNVPLNSPSA